MNPFLQSSVFGFVFEGTSVYCYFVVAFFLAACGGAFANYCVDVCGWTPRRRSPWRRFPKEVVDIPQRSLLTKVPIVGWLVLACGLKSQKTSLLFPLFGCESRSFWIRPFIGELGFAILLSWRFWTLNLSCTTPFTLWLSWFIELTFFWFLLCAAFVDFDDYIIPDVLTITGTILALLLSFGSIMVSSFSCSAFSEPSLLIESPQFLFLDIILYSLGLHGIEPTLTNYTLVDCWVFVFCAFIWTFWAFALLDRRFYPRFGFRKAFAIFGRRLRRSALTPIIGVIWILGLFFIYLVVAKWCSITQRMDLSFPNCLEVMPIDRFMFSLWGLWVGMTMIWAVRVLGGASLGKEAMGFGDVTLAGLIGAFLGWQGSVVVFFIAPFFGLVFGIVRFFFSRAPMIPYGPFLALAAVVYVVYRDEVSEATSAWFEDPVFLMGIGVVGLTLLCVLLVLLRFIKLLFHR